MTGQATLYLALKTDTPYPEYLVFKQGEKNNHKRVATFKSLETVTALFPNYILCCEGDEYFP